MNKINFNVLIFLIVINMFNKFVFSHDSKTPEFITELSDSDYENFIKSEVTKKFLIFYLDTCSHCKRAMNVLEQVRSDKNNDLTDVNFGAINCNENKYSCMAFKIKHVPFMILIQENKYKEFKSYPVPEEIYKFIENGVEEEGSLFLPEPQTVFRMFFGIVNEITEGLTELIQESLNQNGYDIKWQNSYTIILFIVGIVCLIIIEIIILNYCFSRVSKKTENIAKENVNTLNGTNLNGSESNHLIEEAKSNENLNEKSELEKKNQ